MKMVLAFLGTVGVWFVFFAVVAAYGFFFLPNKPEPVRYMTEQFNDPNSRIPSMFACTFAGKKSGLGPNAGSEVISFMQQQGVSGELVNLWIDDAKTYVMAELQDVDWTGYWKEFCDKPFQNMRNFGAFTQ